MISPDGTGRTHLTNLTELIANPSWSPDRSRILFQDNVRNQAELFTINRDGTGRSRLTETPERESDPAWSPDGSRIAYVLSGTTNFTDGIYVMNADGTGRQRVLSTFVSDPSWSPDGSRIAFSSLSEGEHVRTIEPAGTDKRTVTNELNAARQPAWSPR